MKYIHIICATIVEVRTRPLDSYQSGIPSLVFYQKVINPFIYFLIYLFFIKKITIKRLTDDCYEPLVDSNSK